MPWPSTTASSRASRPMQFCQPGRQTRDCNKAVSPKRGVTPMLNRPLIYTLCVAAFCLAWCSQAQARNEARIEVGTGVFCDTQRQVERFVAGFGGGSRAAGNAVNAQADGPTGCRVGT